MASVAGLAYAKIAVLEEESAQELAIDLSVEQPFHRRGKILPSSECAGDPMLSRNPFDFR
jgi:hypothetical protein